jgi:hypothetical protein
VTCISVQFTDHDEPTEPAPCPRCGLKRWGADDLQPGAMVCTCNDPDDDHSPTS